MYFKPTHVTKLINNKMEITKDVSTVSIHLIIGNTHNQLRCKKSVCLVNRIIRMDNNDFTLPTKYN